MLAISPGRSGQSFDYPGDQAIADLAKKHNFPEGLDAVAGLKSVWEWWRADHHIRPEPRASDKKKLLSAIAEHAGSLSDILGRCGMEEYRALEAVAAKNELSISEIRDLCEDVRLSAMIGSASVERGRAGRHRDRPMLNLVARLFRLWVAAFGEDAPRISRAGDYGGPFFELCNDVLLLFGVRKSNAALGRTIVKAIAALESAVTEGRITQIASNNG